MTAVINPSYSCNYRNDSCKKVALTILFMLEFKFKSVSSVVARVRFVFILFYCSFIIFAEMVDAQSMVAWELTEYGSAIKPVVTAVPKVKGPYDVLVKVTATSVNPLDILMIDGYGKVFLNALRRINHLFTGKSSEFPIILGRDFVGVVVEKGTKVTSVQIGDTVIGVTRPHEAGSHAEYVLLTDNLISKKPEHLSDEEAASLLYAGLTAWSALKVSGLLYVRNTKNKKVLVVGACGGVGTIAVQLLKSWGATVGATCSKSAIPVVSKLNPDFFLDYTDPNFKENLDKNGPYDIILDAAGIPETDFKLYTKHLKQFSLATFITLQPPVLPNTDKYGLILGNIKTIADFFIVNIYNAPVLSLSSIRWGIFVPFPSAIKELAQLAEERKVVPIVEKTFSFSETPEAYAKVKAGHLRGKIVILVNDADKLRN